MDSGSLALKCKPCGREIPAADIHLESGLAKCAGCHAVFRIADQLHEREKAARGPATLPANMTVASDARALTVVRRWKRGPAYIVLGAALFWNLIVSVFLVALASGAKFKDSDTGEPASTGFMLLILSPFVLVGAGVAYTALALLLNRTTIRLDSKRLAVTQGPLWWPGGRAIDPAEISQLYCTEYVAYTQNNRPVHRMCVNALLKGGAHVELIKGIDEPGQSFYLEELLEDRLGIESRPVHGEYTG